MEAVNTRKDNMFVINRYLKKKDPITVSNPVNNQYVGGRDAGTSSQYVINRYLPKIEVQPSETVKQPTSLLDKVKGVGNYLGKLAVSSGIVASNVVSKTIDFLGDAVSRLEEKNLQAPYFVAEKVFGKKGATEVGKKRAEAWKNFYASNTGKTTEQLKSITKSLENIEYIQPSEEWKNLSFKQRFEPKHWADTFLNMGPGIIGSWGLYAVNIPLGVITTFGSTADDVKDIALENGASEDQALLLSTSTGFAVAAIDKMIPEKVFSPSQKKKFISGFVKRAIKTGLKETGTEIVQEDIQILAEATVREDLGVDEFLQRNIMAGLGGFLGGVGADSTVSFINGIKNGEIALGEKTMEETTIDVEPKTPPNAPERPVAPDVTTDTTEQTKPIPTTGQVEQKGQTVTKQEEPVKVSEIKKQKVQEVTRQIEKNVTDIKSTKITLKKVNQQLSQAVSMAEGRAEVAKTLREGVNVENINKLKRIYANTKAFQGGDIETIRASKHKDLLNTVVKNVQENYPDMGEAEAFDFALNLPTKGEESTRTPEIRQLETRQKNLSEFLDLLKKRQTELNIQEDTELSKEWTQAMALQEKLTKLVQVPRRQLPVGEGKQKVSRLQARLKGALDKTSQEDIEALGLSTYKQMNQNEQIAKAVDYVEGNTEEALKVVNGEIDPPEGILQNSVYAALVEKAALDTDLATKVASLTSTRFGQEINILKKIMADNPAVMMQDIVQARIEAYEQKTGKKATERVKKETKRITEKVKPTTKEQWNSFIESIRC